ncbi:MAG TPA: ribonuclease R [Acidobacteriota bacterium]|nr:ribonuclease R [Acidobacteriota bacterium]
MKKKNQQNDIESAVLAYLNKHRDSSYSSRDLAKHLRVKKRDFKPFRRILRQLAGAGKILQREEGIFQSVSGKGVRVRKKGKPERKIGRVPEEQLEGTLQQYRAGFAFVTPSDKNREDVFIPPGATGGALNGDRVLIRITRPQGQRKAEGQVVKILERKTRNLVGVFRMEAHQGRVIPWDKKFQIQPEVRTKNFAGATDGMLVEAEIISEGPDPEARIIALLGFPGEPDLDAKIIVSKHNLPRYFSTEVLEQAEEVARILPQDYEGRKDFRQWHTVTIDGEKARDFDDAISISAFKNGTYLLGVHIADVANYVKPGTPLDREAEERGNSVYFPDLVIPMLPEKLSNEICSLNPQVDRLTMSAVMKIGPDGEVLEYHLYPSVINSNERMTYTAVKKIVEDRDPEMLRRYEPIIEMFFNMKKLALLLMAKRRLRGSIDFDLPEPEIILDLTTGRMMGVIKSERNIAHRIIEEFMLLANEIVATHLWKSGLPSIYRVHESPVPEKIMDFAAIAASLGYRLPADPKNITPKELQKLLEKVEGRPEERFLNVLMLRSMARARYDRENSGHFGLALESYTHFTSPIRRYPDLMVHRALKALLSKRKVEVSRIEKTAGLIPEIAEHCSFTERRADDAEREYIQLKKVEFMHDKLGEVYEGYITGVASFGMFVELKEFFVEGLIPLKYMDDDHYVFHDKRHFFKGRKKGKVYRLGDEVKVQVVKVDRDRREIDFLLSD